MLIGCSRNSVTVSSCCTTTEFSQKSIVVRNQFEPSAPIAPLIEHAQVDKIWIKELIASRFLNFPHENINLSQVFEEKGLNTPLISNNPHRHKS